MKKDTDGPFILIEGTMHQEDVTLIKVGAPPRGAPKCTRQLPAGLKGETDRKSVTGGGLMSVRSDVDRSSKQKINKEITSLNDTLDPLDKTDVYRAFHPQTAAYALLSGAHGTLSRIEHILGHRDTLNEHRRLEIIATMLSDHKALKREIDGKKEFGGATNMWRLNNMVLTNNWVRGARKREVKRYVGTNGNDSATYQNRWDMTKLVIRGEFVSTPANLTKQDEPK